MINLFYRGKVPGFRGQVEKIGSRFKGQKIGSRFKVQGSRDRK